MFATVWLPALVGGLVTAYSSSNGGTNFGVGFFPALIVTLVFSVWAIQDLVGSGSPFAACPALLTAVVLLVLGVVPVYRDVPLSQANVTLSSGPFAGLRTNRPKQAFLARLQRDLARVDARCRILFFNDFPAGYLLTAAQPDTNAVWTATVPGPLVFAYHRDLLGYFRRHGLPDVAVMMLRIPFGLPASARRDTYPDRDPLVARLRTPPFHVVARRLDYVVYARDRC
jgi:hypothetical protein